MHCIYNNKYIGTFFCQGCQKCFVLQLAKKVLFSLVQIKNIFSLVQIKKLAKSANKKHLSKCSFPSKKILASGYLEVRWFVECDDYIVVYISGSS